MSGIRCLEGLRHRWWKPPWRLNPDDEECRVCRIEKAIWKMTATHRYPAAEEETARDVAWSARQYQRQRLAEGRAILQELRGFLGAPRSQQLESARERTSPTS